MRLTRELATLKIHESEALMTYVGRANALRAEHAGGGHRVRVDTANMHVLAGLPPVHKTVKTVLLAAGVSLMWNPGALESGIFCCIRIYSTSPDMHSGLTI